MGLFDWMRKPALPENIYSVMSEDHVLLYSILGELRHGAGERTDDASSKVQKRKRCRDVVHRLIKESREHFLREEVLMEQYHYPDIRAHRSEHLMMIRRIEMYNSRLISGTVPLDEDPSQYLKGWLTTHIRTTDRRLERFLFDSHKNRDMHGQMALGVNDLARFNSMVAAGRSLRKDQPVKR